MSNNQAPISKDDITIKDLNLEDLIFVEEKKKPEKPIFKNEEKFIIPINFFGLLILQKKTLKSLQEENNVTMEILPNPPEDNNNEADGTTTSTTTTTNLRGRRQILQINGEPENVEKAVAVVEGILKDAKIQLHRILSSNSKSFDEGGTEFECPICCEIFDIEKDGCVTCFPFDHTDPPTEMIKLHSICVNCIQDYAKSAITGRVAPGGLGLHCVADKCSNIFLLNSFEKYLNEEVKGPFLTRLQDQCLLDTNLSDLVTCHNCGLKVCVPLTDAFYICECGRKQCRWCPRIYDSNHHEKTCKELADQEASSQKLESKMSEIVVRKCYKCGTQFIKDEACNLMESCPCGAKQCYICGEPEITYEHFCHCERGPRHGKCQECGKSCRQWENDKELDEMRLADFQRSNGTNINIPRGILPSSDERVAVRNLRRRNPDEPNLLEERIRMRDEAMELLSNGARRHLVEIRNMPNYEQGHNNPFLANLETGLEHLADSLDTTREPRNRPARAMNPADRDSLD